MLLKSLRKKLHIVRLNVYQQSICDELLCIDKRSRKSLRRSPSYPLFGYFRFVSFVLIRGSDLLASPAGLPLPAILCHGTAELVVRVIVRRTCHFLPISATAVHDTAELCCLHHCLQNLPFSATPFGTNA
jgi:hypothetical protein